MNTSRKIEEYLKRLLLKNNSNNLNLLLNEIFGFLEGIQTNDAIGKDLIISKLFCRAIEALDQNSLPNNEIQYGIINAFKNIRTIYNNDNNKENGELMCLYLLNLLYTNQNYFNEMNKDSFVGLLSNLEKIRILFKLTDEDNNLVFPIGSLLAKVVVCDDLFDKINNVEYVQTLMLALQVFNEAQYKHA